MPKLIAVHQDAVQTIVNANTITHFHEEGPYTKIYFIGHTRDHTSFILVTEDIAEIADMIGEVEGA